MIKNRYLDGLSLVLTRWPIGLLPGKIQERIARRYDRNNYSYFHAQLIGSTCVSLGIYITSQVVESPNSELLKYIDEITLTYILAGRIIPTGIRYLLSRGIKRPIGSYTVEATSILLEKIYTTKPAKKSLEKIIDITERLKRTA